MSQAEPHQGGHGGLWCQESGPEMGPVVVLIHGSLDRSSGFAKVARCLPDRRVMRFDRRGYAKSSTHPGPYTTSGNVEDVEALLSGRSAVLIGHSFGGNVALATAQRLPKQIIGVSTFETPLSWMEWWPSNTAGGLAVGSKPEDAAEQFMVRLIGRERWDALPNKTRTDRRNEGHTLQQELMDLRQRAPWDAKEIECLVLSGFGSKGSRHHHEGARWIVNNVREARLVEVLGAGHGAPVTHPTQFVDQLIRPHFEGKSTFNVTV